MLRKSLATGRRQLHPAQTLSCSLNQLSAQPCSHVHSSGVNQAEDTAGVATSSLPYETFQPLSTVQRAALTFSSAVGALINPARADLVGTLGELTGQTAFQRMRTTMQADAVGQHILSLRPLMTDAELQQAHSMPEGSFGKAYADFMGIRSFRADDRPPVRFIADPELAYVALRARQVHDFWHVLFDCPTTVLGELAIKAVEFVQTGLPMTGLAVAGAQWRLKPDQRQRLIADLLPWALRAGTRCHDLMCIHYEEHFSDDLEALRRKFRIQTAPSAWKPTVMLKQGTLRQIQLGLRLLHA
ncbi:hypothetical protein WJX74_006190 [Apatococcus lobatus]|uniref:Ubiquinone biosynthesis protein COQ4 homolog, mitochondrial n=1 Tax=Apatococcus lobatus TaxID=904363 RepID=A0AAW1QJU3_9CHLO